MLRNASTKRSVKALAIIFIAGILAFIPGSSASALFVPNYISHPTPSSYTGCVAEGPDGNMWYTSRSTGNVGKVTPGGVVTEYTTTSGNDTFCIAAGADGNMWYTVYDANIIGKITPSGVSTEYTIPTPSTFPAGIAQGPDGNMWFTSGDADRVGKITPSGVITEYTVPGTVPGLWGITAGPDGNMWFAQTQGHKIGKISMSGVITQYSLDSSDYPVNLIAGPDGNIWFTINISNQIGKITPSGVVTKYTPSNVVHGITVGPDNLIWFSVLVGAYNIGSITTDGVITEYALAGDPYMLEIASGPGNTIWGADYNPSGAVGRLAFPSNPSLSPTTGTATAGVAVGINVLPDDSDADPGTLTIVAQPSHGTAVANTDGTITYTASSSFTGTDQVTYRMCSVSYDQMCTETTLTLTVVAGVPNTGVQSAFVQNGTAYMVGLLGIAAIVGAAIVYRRPAAALLRRSNKR